MVDTDDRLIVWHDGNCPMCRREIALMKRLDRGAKINFIDVVDADDTSCPLSREALLARFHAMENGELLSGAAAMAAIWRAIPILRPLGMAARWKPMLALMERLYLRFLKIRPRLQKLLR